MPTSKHKSTKSGARKSTRNSGTAGSKTSGRKYSPKAGEYVKAEMEEMKEGKLRSGRSGKKVRNPKQAVAIGLSEARKAGVKVPKSGRKAA
jgi:hypothetical protein